MRNPRKPDRVAMAAAIQDFLRAAGLPLKNDPNLADTPERVAEAWAERVPRRLRPDARGGAGRDLPGAAELVR